MYGVVLNEILQLGYLGSREVFETNTAASHGQEALTGLSSRPAITDHFKGHILQIEAIAFQEDIYFRGSVFMIGGYGVLKGEALIANIYDLP